MDAYLDSIQSLETKVTSMRGAAGHLQHDDAVAGASTTMAGMKAPIQNDDKSANGAHDRSCRRAASCGWT